jgi:hypothetical protein
MLLFIVATTLVLLSQATPQSRVRTAVVNPFNGRWQLNMTDATECSDPMLELIGLSATLRNMIRSLNVVESFEFTERTLKLGRITLYSNDLDTLQLGRSEQITDRILGRVQQTVDYVTGGRINTVIVRPDRSVFTSVRKIQLGSQVFSNSMNFTTSDGRFATCVRFYSKLKTTVYLHTLSKHHA